MGLRHGLGMSFAGAIVITGILMLVLLPGRVVKGDPPPPPPDLDAGDPQVPPAHMHEVSFSLTGRPARLLGWAFGRLVRPPDPPE